MHVLLVTMQYGPGYGQGTERYLSILREHLGRAGVETSVLAGDPNQHFASAELGAARDFDPNVNAFPSTGWMAIGGLPVEDLRGLWKTQRPDVIHIANPAHIGLNIALAAREEAIPTVLTTMDFWWVCPKQTLLRRPGGDLIETCRGPVDWRTCLCCIANERTGSTRASLAQTPLLGRQLIPASYLATWKRRGLPQAELQAWPNRQDEIARRMNVADAVIFPSQATAERIGPLLDGPATHRIPYGLEPRWFQATSRRTRPSDRSKVRLGYAGALAQHKGVHTLLEAVRIAGWYDVEICIAGTGEAGYAEYLRRLGQGLNVRFDGRVGTEQMPEWLSDLDLLIMPSLWPENLPIITLETASRGVPLLCSDIEGVVELVPSEARFTPGDARDLARQLQNWWETDAWPKPAPVSSAQQMTDATLGVYREVLTR